MLLSMALVISEASAQYELGAALGVYRNSLQPRKSDGHASAQFWHVSNPGLIASVFYRERGNKHTNLGFELQYTRKSFHARYSDGGLAGSYGTDAHVDLDLLHVNITLETKLNERGNAVIRFGPQLGFKLGGWMTGESWVSVPYNYSRSAFQHQAIPDFGGDLRFLLGMGFRSGAKSGSGVSFDPFLSAAIGSILKEAPGAKGMEYGMRLGFFLLREKTTLTQWVDRKPPTPPSGPNW